MLVPAFLDSLAAADGPLPFDTAVRTAHAAETPAGAFAAGYAAALRSLFPMLPSVRACLCATEGGGAHPRAIATRLEPVGGGWVLDGEKGFVTGGLDAELLLVVATTGLDEEQRPRLRVVMVPAQMPGVSLMALPALPFVPEISHARVRFEHVTVEESAVLPGDGYTRYLKPFRTVEDLHVHAALYAWLLGVGERSRWPAPLLARILATLAAARTLAAADPTQAATHLALAGLLDQARALLAELEPCWATTDEATRALWERDKPLLSVAEKARVARTEAAVKSLLA